MKKKDWTVRKEETLPTNICMVYGMLRKEEILFGM
jgi:hypothetical protein